MMMMMIIYMIIDLKKMKKKKNLEIKQSILKNNHLKVYFNKGFKSIIIELFQMLRK